MAFSVETAVPLLSIEVDLLGDGRPGVLLRGVDLGAVTGVRFTPAVAGEFQLQLRVEDGCGRRDATGAPRPVTVRP